ncbi:MAG: TlpA family protein disulfide reductase [Xanthomonadales bacterium]|nr:TlpA family protein disulfide reductase [Xanthomonadales bacterium]
MRKTSLLLAVLIFLAGSVPPLAAQPAKSLVGTRPDLSVDTLDHGRFDLADQRGRWVVVNFWATWCAPCIKEIPELSALADRDDVEVIGLDFEEIEREDLLAFLVRHPARYPIAPIDVYDPPTAFPVPRGMPMTYVLDPAGVVAEAFLGPVTGADIEAVIARGPAPVGAADGAVDEGPRHADDGG